MLLMPPKAAGKNTLAEELAKAEASAAKLLAKAEELASAAQLLLGAHPALKA